MHYFLKYLQKTKANRITNIFLIFSSVFLGIVILYYRIFLYGIMYSYVAPITLGIYFSDLISDCVHSLINNIQSYRSILLLTILCYLTFYYKIKFITLTMIAISAILTQSIYG